MNEVLLILMFIVPVFAQSDNSTELNSLQEDSVLSEINSELKTVNHNIQELSEMLNNVTLNSAILDNQREQNSNIMVLVTTIFGVMIGYLLSESKEISSEYRQKSKIKNLLKSDFERINNLVIEDIQLLDKELTKLNQENNEKLEDLVLNEVYNRTRDLETYLNDFYLNYEFNFWIALIASGSLIKLNEKEIRSIQVARDTISDENKMLDEIYKGIVGRMYQYTTAYYTNPKAFKINLIIELNSIKEHAVHVYDTCQEELNELRWMKLKQIPK